MEKITENTEAKTPLTEKDSAKDGETKHKTRAGSGYLKQLFSTAKTTATNTHTQLKNLTTFLVNFVPVDKIDASELQVRTYFDDNEIEALAHSIREHGVLQPILVVQDGDRYKVIAGERRLRASKRAGVDRIPARVLSTDDKGTHEVALRENLDRVDLHPLEEGEGYLSLLETRAYTSYESIAKAFGKPKSRITECIGFTRLPDATKQELLRVGAKQRSLLRLLLSNAPEKHVEIIRQFLKDEEERASQRLENPEQASTQTTAAAAPVNGEAAATPESGTTTAPETAAAPQLTPAPKKREPKPFDYKCDDKGVTVPGFRWKVGEGPEKLDGFVIAMRKLLEEAQTRWPGTP